MNGYIKKIDKRDTKKSLLIDSYFNKEFFFDSQEYPELQVGFYVSYWIDSNEHITIKKILYITLENLLKHYPFKIEFVSRFLNDDYLKRYGDNYKIYPHQFKRIFDAWKQENDKKATLNNPNNKREQKEAFQKEDRKNVLIIDFIFSSKMLEQYNYEKTIANIINKFKIDFVNIILDDKILENEMIISQLERLRDEVESLGSVSLEISQVHAKSNKGFKSQRADMVIAGKIAQHSNNDSDVFLFSGDSDFIPVIEYCTKGKVTIVYFKKGETDTSKYSYHLTTSLVENNDRVFTVDVSDCGFAKRGNSESFQTVDMWYSSNS